MAENRDVNVDHCIVEYSPQLRDQESVKISSSESSAFYFLSSQCYLKWRCVWDVNDRKIRIYLKSHPALNVSYYVTTHLSKGNRSISYPKKLIKDSTEFIWSSSIKVIDEMFPGFEKYNPVFRFIFQKEPDINYDSKFSGHKSVQTAFYSNGTNSLEKLSDDFDRFLRGEIQHDVELRSGDHVFKAHKAVLRARSNFFKKKLESAMNDQLELHYIDPAALNEIRLYIYTGKSTELSFELAKKIYKAGEACDTGCLREQCVEILIDSMTLDNACECLTFADDDSFKERVIGFIIDKEIPYLDEYWKPFCDQYPKLANNVLNKLIKMLPRRRA